VGRGVKVLVACEFSARVRDAFRERGHDAWSVDIVPTLGDPSYHIQDDAITAIYTGVWDMIIAFPPCTYLTNSNAWRWDAIVQERLEALQFVRDIMACDCPRIAVENPVGAIGTQIRKADQYIQPWQFGDPYQKTTGLWLHGLPPLKPDVPVKPSNIVPWVQGTYRTHQGYGTVRKSKDRSLTFTGIARAMADQWGQA
jgi:hypothetical protein